MAVLLETSKGDIVIDLHVDECPNTSKNFLKLCKIKYFNNCLFHNLQPNFIAQTGDPTGTGRGGSSIYGVMYGDQARFFDDELRPSLRHTSRGTVAMASGGPHLNASQFYITLSDGQDSLDEKHTVFGQVSEGFEVLDKLNEAFVDPDGRPYQNTRIRHTIILDDPFDDPPQLAEHIPEASPEPTFEQGDRLEDDWAPAEDTRTAEEVEEAARRSEAENRAVVLEMIGDLPEADAKPPANMLFVAKLNAVTTEEDLEIIFARFGVVTSCDIIRDAKTGDSLCYGFIGFDTEAACEEAYFKMNNVLVDDRRIKVDFSQSVSHIWKQFKKFGRKGGSKGLQEDGGGHGDGGGRGSGGPGGGRSIAGGRLELREGRHGGGNAHAHHSAGGMLFDHGPAAADQDAPHEHAPRRHKKRSRSRDGHPAPSAARGSHRQAVDDGQHSRRSSERAGASQQDTSRRGQGHHSYERDATMARGNSWHERDEQPFRRDRESHGGQFDAARRHRNESDSQRQGKQDSGREQSHHTSRRDSTSERPLRGEERGRKGISPVCGTKTGGRDTSGRDRRESVRDHQRDLEREHGRGHERVKGALERHIR